MKKESKKMTKFVKKIVSENLYRKLSKKMERKKPFQIEFFNPKISIWNFQISVHSQVY